MMKAVTNQESTSKVGGAALIVGSVTLLIGNILHPRVGTIFNPVQPSGPEILSKLITGNIGQHYFSHMILVLVGPSWMLGFLALYGVLGQKNERLFALPSILLSGLFTLMLTLAGVMHGIVEPVLAQNYLAASPNARELAGAILEYSDVLTTTIGAASFFVLWLSVILLGASLVKAQLYHKAIAWAGIVLGLIGVLGYGAGIFGPYFFFSPLFAPFAIIISIWALVLGVFLYRGK